MSSPSFSCRRITQRHNPHSKALVLPLAVALTLACKSLLHSCAQLEFDSFCQYPRARNQHEWTVPAGATHRDRPQPGLGLLSPDWPLPTGHGLRYQPWNPIRSFPGCRHGKFHKSDFCYLCCFSGSDKCCARRHCDFSDLHFSGSQDHRRRWPLDIPALKYHRAAGRHRHL